MPGHLPDGQRSQRLGEQLEAMDLHRDLAGAGLHQGAVDAEVVPRTRWDLTRLAEGQKVEVVHAVQGG